MKITNEKQYWEQFYKWEKELKLVMNMKKLTDPAQFLEDYKAILREGVNREVISKEYYQESIDKLNKSLTEPSKLKDRVKQKIVNLFNKLKKDKDKENKQDKNDKRT